VGAARVARTIADLDGSETVSAAHVMESLHYQPGARR
jgi:predicted ATPase with chaperone activity